MDEKDIAYVVVSRYNIFDTSPQMPGSTAIRANCGHQAWISPSGRRFLDGEGKGAYIMCDKCIPPQQAADDPEMTAARIPGADEEFRDLLGPELAEKLLEWLGKKGFPNR